MNGEKCMTRIKKKEWRTKKKKKSSILTSNKKHFATEICTAINHHITYVCKMLFLGFVPTKCTLKWNIEIARTPSHAYTHTNGKRELNEYNNTVFIIFFFIVSQLYIEHEPYTHACARAYRERRKKQQKREHQIFSLLSLRLYSIVHTYTHSELEKKNSQRYMGAIKIEKWSERLTKKEAHTLRAVFVFVLVVVLTLPVDRIQHGHCPQ